MGTKPLYNALRKLRPSGAAGFEGLIAALLTKLTGIKFILSKSGYQAGRDMSSEGQNSNIIAVECKRFNQDSDLNERELLGELEQINSDIPELDLWVLVASRTINDQLDKSLVRSAHVKGFEVLIIDTTEHSDGVPSSLSCLCAFCPDIVNRFVGNGDEINTIFDTIKKHPEYPNIIKKIKNDFSLSYIGYENWRQAQNKWLIEQFESEKHSRASFGQVINILDKNIKNIIRENANKIINKWYSAWPESFAPFVMLGEEGDGKTWSICSWLSTNISNDSDFSPVLFLTSTNISKTTEPEKLLAASISKQAMSKQFNNFDAEYWQKKLKKWMSRPDHDKPLIILVIDGIKEGGDFDWRQLFEKIATTPYGNSIAVILTCRSVVWEKQYSNLTYLNFKEFPITPFDDNELDNALSYHGLQHTDFQPEVLSLLRRPRYFDLAIKHRQAIEDSGDITINRLIYEDWKDRISRKSHKRMDNNGFQSILRDLAQKTIFGPDAFSERDIENLIPSHYKDDVQEFISGDILTPDLSKSGKYKIEPKRLVMGLGLLLKERIHLAINKNEDVEEQAAYLLEPNSDMDIKVNICGSAVLHAILDNNYPEAGTITLYKLWLNGRNLSEDAFNDVVAYFPICPEIYFTLAEYFWSEKHENSIAQELIMESLLKWKENQKIFALMQDVFFRWMGFLNPFGFAFQRGTTDLDDKKAIEFKLSIEQKVGSEIQSDYFDFAGYKLPVTKDDGILRLARVALAVISHCKRTYFIKAFVAWALSRAIMGFNYEFDIIAWVLRTAREDIWGIIKKEVDSLVNKDKTICDRASYYLLTCFGSDDSYKYRQTLPDDIVPLNISKERYDKDPCNQKFFAWQKDNYEYCLERDDISINRVIDGLAMLSLEPELPVPPNINKRFNNIKTNFAPDRFWKTMNATIEDDWLEKIKSTLSTFAPKVYVDIIQSIVNDVLNRKDKASLQHLSFKIAENSIILTHKEREAVKQIWFELIDKYIELDNRENNIEVILFPTVLYFMDAKDQIEALLIRPKDAPDLVSYAICFKKIRTEELENYLFTISTETDDTKIKRILWFLSYNCQALNDKLLDNIIQFATHEETIIRASVLKIIYKVGSSKHIQLIVNSKWRYNADNWNDENAWGSLIISEYGKKLSYSEIRSRIHPLYWGYAIEKRGNKKKEIIQYATDIDIAWSAINHENFSTIDDIPLTDVECDMADLPLLNDSIGISPNYDEASIKFRSWEASWGGISHNGDPDKLVGMFDRKAMTEKYNGLISQIKKIVDQQKSNGNFWFGDRFKKYALGEALDHQPDLLKKWLNPIFSKTKDTWWYLYQCQSFYESLLDILIYSNPDDFLKLYNIITSYPRRIAFIEQKTRIKLSLYSLFSNSNNSKIIKKWDELFCNCKNDMELFELALVAQQKGNTTWLKEFIKQNIISPWNVDKARAIILIGFMDGEDFIPVLEEQCNAPSSWLSDVTKNADMNYKRNIWAKEWFRRFLNDDDNIQAWGYFNLFLKCVDRRFLLWKKQIMSESKIEPAKIDFFNLNQDAIRKNIEKNEKNRSGTLFCEKLLDNQAYPWMTTKN